MEMKSGRDLEPLHDLCRLRSTLEAFAVNRWRQFGSKDATSEQLGEILKQLKALATQGDYLAFHKVDAQLHRTLISSIGLPSLLASWDAVAADLDPWVLEVKETYWLNLMALYREHVLLLEAWHSDDDWVAAEATHQHLEAGWHRIAVAQENFDHQIDPVERAICFISTHYASHLDVEWIARHVSFLSASHLTRLFKRRVDISPYGFLKRVRLERAAQLLRSGPDAVSLVAKRVGYRNASHFVRDFRLKFNTTPLAYRRGSTLMDRRQTKSTILDKTEKMFCFDHLSILIPSKSCPK